MQRNKADLSFYFFIVLKENATAKKTSFYQNAEDRRLCLSVEKNVVPSFAKLYLTHKGVQLSQSNIFVKL